LNRRTGGPQRRPEGHGAEKIQVLFENENRFMRYLRSYEIKQ
jgi:hypothetical protein